jgi:hypothetical protein
MKPPYHLLHGCFIEAALDCTSIIDLQPRNIRVAAAAIYGNR